MAAIDYTRRGKGSFAKHALLTANAAHLDATITLTSFTSNDGSTGVEAGNILMVDDEFMFVLAVSSVVTVERGCADSIPAAHASGADVWIIDAPPSSDGLNYTSGSTIGVKLLPYTSSGQAVPIEYAPPHALALNWRHARPYPPANFKCATEPWFTRRFVMLETESAIVFTWAHRDRLLQMDQMVGHTNGSIGPEPGVTYTIRVYDDTDVLRRTVTGVTGETWTYTRAMAEDDFVLGPLGYIEIHSTRDALDSLYGYQTMVEIRGLTFGEDESKFDFTLAGYIAPTSGDSISFENAGYTPPSSN